MENIEPTKISYPITIDYKVFADFMLNTKPDTQRTKSENVIGNWVAEMEKKVAEKNSQRATEHGNRFYFLDNKCSTRKRYGRQNSERQKIEWLCSIFRGSLIFV